MKHLHYIPNETTLLWDCFTIEKNKEIREIYGADDGFKLLRMTTGMQGNEYPKTIFVIGKKYKVQFNLLHRCMLDGLPAAIYVPMVPYTDSERVETTRYWRIVLQ